MDFAPPALEGSVPNAAGPTRIRRRMVSEARAARPPKGAELPPAVWGIKWVAVERLSRLRGGRRKPQVGMFPCFLGGRACRLVASMRKASARRGRVSLGTITPSMYPREAAM